MKTVRFQRLMIRGFIACAVAIAWHSPATAAPLNFFEPYQWTSASCSGHTCTWTATSPFGAVTAVSSGGWAVGPSGGTNFTPALTNQFLANDAGGEVTITLPSGLNWGAAGGELILGNIHNYFYYNLSATDGTDPINVNAWTLLGEDLNSTSSTSGCVGGSTVSVLPGGACSGASTSMGLYVFDAGASSGSGQGGVVALGGLPSSLRTITLTFVSNNLGNTFPNGGQGNDFILFNVGQGQAVPEPSGGILVGIGVVGMMVLLRRSRRGPCRTTKRSEASQEPSRSFLADALPHLDLHPAPALRRGHRLGAVDRCAENRLLPQNIRIAHRRVLSIVNLGGTFRGYQKMRYLLLCAGLVAAPALHGSVILLGIPTFGTTPFTNCANTSFSPGVNLASTANGFSATGTVTVQLSGPLGTACTVSWSASVPVLLTAGAFAVDGTIDAELTLPANAAPLATFFTRTTLQGFPSVDTVLPIGNGQHLTAFSQSIFPAVAAGGSILTQEFNFTVCPCPNAGTVTFHIPVSAGITDVPEPDSATLVLIAAALLTLTLQWRSAPSKISPSGRSQSSSSAV